MQKTLVLLLMLVLMLSLFACSAPHQGDNDKTEQTSLYSNNEEMGNSNTNFASAGGGVLYHNGYTFFISGSTVLASYGYGKDFYEADFELLRI